MNSHQRFVAALRSQKTDRVPVVPKIWVDFSAKMTNTPIADVIRSPLTAMRVIAEAGSQLGFDAVRQFPFPKREIVSEQGDLYEVRNGKKIGKIDISGGLATYLFDPGDYRIDDPFTISFCHSWATSEPTVNSVEDARQIAVPDSDVFDELGWAENLNQIRDEFGKDLCFIGDCDSATMSFYISFRGLNTAMFDLINEPQLVHSVMEKGAEVAIARGKYWLDNGIKVLRLNDSTGNMSLISPAHWREFIYPHIKTVCDELHNYNSDALIYCHICGNVLPIIEDLVEAGLDCIGPLDPLGGFTVKQAREKVVDNVSLMGGVNTLTLLEGTPDQVKEESHQCIQGAGEKGGFILGSGCVVPRDCPKENLVAMVESASEFKSNSY